MKILGVNRKIRKASVQINQLSVQNCTCVQLAVCETLSCFFEVLTACLLLLVVAFSMVLF